MTKEQYERWSAPFRGRRAMWIARCDRLLTAFVYVAYFAVLLWAFWRDGRVPWRGLWVPASWLVLVTLLRRLIDRPRPYERLAIEPLIKKETKGRSMPSRHAFSVWVIAMVAWALCPLLGAVLTVVGVLLCMTRVIGGVHDEWDVAVGAAIGIGSGILGLWLLP